MANAHSGDTTGHGNMRMTERMDWRRLLRFILAGLIVGGMVAGTMLVTVGAGQSVVVTQFGAPVRILTRPGLNWKLPAPLQSTTIVDLRLHTTSSGLQDVGTREGLRILVQAYLAWEVPNDPARIGQFLRTANNNPDEVAQQLRSLTGSALQIVAGNYNLADLVNTDPSKVRLDAFEHALQSKVAQQALDIYGITIKQLGVERLSLPAETLAATVARMRAERETVAAERTAEGMRAAAQIRSDANRDARILTARAAAEAATIEAQSREQAARTYGAAYSRDPQLYSMLRSLDTLGSVIGPRTELILRTDAAPFHLLVQGPPANTAPMLRQSMAPRLASDP